jgi:hypothetical protein
MSEQQANNMPSCAMMRVEKQANGLAPHMAGGRTLTEEQNTTEADKNRNAVLDQAQVDQSAHNAR